MLNPFNVPVLKNRQWRFLLRELVAGHPRLQREAGTHLQPVLQAPVAVAWWIATFAPELLGREELHVLLPGAGMIECMDEGRWFSFLPDLLGRRNMRVQVTLVGDELAFNQEEGAVRTVGASLAHLRREWRTPLADAVKDRPTAVVYNGLLHDWAAQNQRPVDACVFLAPGFVQYWRGWFTEGDLLAVLCSPAAVGVMPLSRMDALADMHALHVCGLLPQIPEMKRNPFAREHELSRFIGSYAQYAWEWPTQRGDLAFHLAEDKLLEFESLEEYVKEEFQELGDEGLERLGDRWEVVNKNDGSSDAILVLPGELGILESSRVIGEFDEKGFRPFEPHHFVPPEALADRPTEPFLLSRLFWAARVHKEWVAPVLEELDSQEEQDEPAGRRLFGGVTDEDMAEAMEVLAAQMLGQKVDGAEVMREMRALGIAHGPMHPCWFDLLETLGWGPEKYVEDPGRLQPAFSVVGPRRRIELPVICEAYAFFPDDEDDDLAKEAMDAVAKAHLGGALLLFKMMPYQEVQGHKYSFGGMLYWQGRWRPFALNRHMKSVDDVLDQVEGGFEFGKSAPAYADDGAAVAAPFNCMCQGLDPNERRKMAGLGVRKWVTLVPA